MEEEREKELASRRFNEFLMNRYASGYRKLVFGEKSRYLSASLSDIICPKADQEKLMEWLKNPDKFLVIYGLPGKGKTQLCAAAFDPIMAKYAMDFRYWKESDFLEKLRNIVADGGNYSSELKYMLNYKCMIFDDIGSTGVNKTDWRQEIMFTAIDTMYSKCIPAILTSNMRENEMAAVYGERFASRVFAKENTIICVDSWPNFREAGK